VKIVTYSPGLPYVALKTTQDFGMEDYMQ